MRVNREWPGRAEPRGKKRRAKPYKLMRKLQRKLREALFCARKATQLIDIRSTILFEPMIMSLLP